MKVEAVTRINKVVTEVEEPRITLDLSIEEAALLMFVSGQWVGGITDISQGSMFSQLLRELHPYLKTSGNDSLPEGYFKVLKSFLKDDTIIIGGNWVSAVKEILK